MIHQPLTMSRRHVLGDLNSRCEPAADVPVFLDAPGGELLGHVDESHGRYADAFTFHLDDQVCKKLATGHFDYSFDYDFASDGDSSLPAGRRRIRLTHIILKSRKGYEKPVSKSVYAVKQNSVEAS